jgi:hypothetical protein
MEKNADNYLKDLYYNLENPKSYSSIENVFRSGNKKSPKLKRKYVKLWFQKQPTATRTIQISQK